MYQVGQTILYRSWVGINADYRAEWVEAKITKLGKKRVKVQRSAGSQTIEHWAETKNIKPLPGF